MRITKTVVGSALGVAFLLPCIAQAQGSSSSTPARLTALEASVAALQTQVATLQTALTNETTARQTADAAALAAANAYADAAIAAEAAARQTGDAATLAAANAYADSVGSGGAQPTTALLAHNFGPVSLNSINPTVVVRLHNVPAGSYAIFAKAIASAQSVGCNLSAIGGLPGDQALFGNFLDDQKNWTVSLIRTVTLTFATDLDLICTAKGAGGFIPTAGTAKILVVKVDSQVIQDGAP